MFANARRWDTRHRTHLENRTEQKRALCLLSRFARWMCACDLIRARHETVKYVCSQDSAAFKSTAKRRKQKLFETYQSVCDVFFNVIRFCCCCYFAYSFASVFFSCSCRFIQLSWRQLFTRQCVGLMFMPLIRSLNYRITSYKCKAPDRMQVCGYFVEISMSIRLFTQIANFGYAAR